MTEPHVLLGLCSEPWTVEVFVVWVRMVTDPAFEIVPQVWVESLTGP